MKNDTKNVLFKKKGKLKKITLVVTRTSLSYLKIMMKKNVCQISFQLKRNIDNFQHFLALIISMVNESYFFKL